MSRQRIYTDKEREQKNIERVKNWQSKTENKSKVQYYQYKSRAKNFINKKSTYNDLLELQELINNRLKELKQE